MFAVATENAVLLFDTQQPFPFAYITDIHYTRLSDISWSPDGRLLMISSTDGYCTFVTFQEGELGLPYDGPIYTFPEPVVEPAPEKVEPPPVVKPEPVDKTPDVIKKTPKIGSIFAKVDKSEIKHDTTPRKRITPTTLTAPRRLCDGEGAKNVKPTVLGAVTAESAAAVEPAATQNVEKVENVAVDRTPEAVRKTPKIASMFAKMKKDDTRRRLTPITLSAPSKPSRPPVETTTDSNSIEIIDVANETNENNENNEEKLDDSEAVKKTPKIDTLFVKVDKPSSGENIVPQKRRITPIALSVPNKMCKLTDNENRNQNRIDNN